jgi:L-fuculose-phosphate aldolase
MLTNGLTHGTSGNVSARIPEGFLITPTGMPYNEMEAIDLVMMDLAGQTIRGARLPSSEWRIHRDLYEARPEVGGIVHAHPPYCATIASLRRDLPAVHYMIAIAGGHTVRCAPYATFGTEELSANTLAALEGRKACLLANHGLVSVGKDLNEAMRISEEIELVAEIYWRSLSAGSPIILDEAEMQRVIEKFRDYGQPK